ncbi:hypothetical protein [Paraburkholderia sediminicola]|uniref:hypothetical protein n=1 Tax=Paraburkholderia sediminicola TaxID=458836 RepID=UPI0038B7FB65
MKTTVEMINAAMQEAVAVGLIPDGVTSAQRELMRRTVQAALDAHATLRAFEEISFSSLSDPQAISAAIASDR